MLKACVQLEPTSPQRQKLCCTFAELNSCGRPGRPRFGSLRTLCKGAQAAAGIVFRLLLGKQKLRCSTVLLEASRGAALRAQFLKDAELRGRLVGAGNWAVLEVTRGCAIVPGP